jgi:hypothetical protein
MRDFSLTKGKAVTPSDSADLSTPGIGLYVGVSGDVKIDTTDGYTLTMVGFAAGVWQPISVKKVYANGTDATDILVGW